MKRFILLGTLITLALFATAVFAGNPSKAAKADAKRDPLIMAPADAAEQDIEKEKGKKSQLDDIDKEKKDKDKTVTSDGSQDSRKEKESKGTSKPDGTDDKKVDKERDAKGTDAAGKPDHARPKKETVVGSVISVNNMTGVIVVRVENSKTERTIAVSRDDLKVLSAGDKVNIDLAPGANTAEKVSIIAEGKGGSKSKGKKKN